MAEVKSSVDKNRTVLREAVPLDSPLSMYIEPTRVCNFKCFYCMHSTRGKSGGALEQTGFRLEHMDMEFFCKACRRYYEFSYGAEKSLLFRIRRTTYEQKAAGYDRFIEKIRF